MAQGFLSLCAVFSLIYLFFLNAVSLQKQFPQLIARNRRSRGKKARGWKPVTKGLRAALHV